MHLLRILLPLCSLLLVAFPSAANAEEEEVSSSDQTVAVFVVLGVVIVGFIFIVFALCARRHRHINRQVDMDESPRELNDTPSSLRTVSPLEAKPNEVMLSIGDSNLHADEQTMSNNANNNPMSRKTVVLPEPLPHETPGRYTQSHQPFPSATASVTSGHSRHASFSLKMSSTASSLMGTPDQSDLQDKAPAETDSSSLRFKKGRVLGVGTFGTVFEAVGVRDGLVMAAKEIKFDLSGGTSGKSQLKLLRRELAIMRELDHENIVKYIAADCVGSDFFILMEFVAGGNLRSLIDKVGIISIQLARDYTQQVLRALAHLHSREIVHRDVKSANVLIAFDGTVKLADFGASRHFATISGMQGTPNWMAPEVVRTDPDVTWSADIWSLGCTVMEMLTGQVPFSWRPGNTISSLVYIASGTDIIEPPESVLDANARDFIAKCLQRDPKERPSASELLSHPFITVGEEEADDFEVRLQRSAINKSLVLQRSVVAGENGNPTEMLNQPEIGELTSFGDAAAMTSMVIDGARDAASNTADIIDIGRGGNTPLALDAPRKLF